MNLESTMFELIIESVLVDVVVEFVKVIFNAYFKTKNIKYKNVVLRSISIGIGILLSIAYGWDFPARLGLTSRISYIGQIITGMLISRGSNSIHDILKKIGVNTKI
ncbi:hypothetical protein [Clostridium sp. ZS2-4]|uniref:hypothetical protein n=1 Tax=Clostridium sp. ZS2-4 TaxID=2987703 RepID=UPI00227A2E81|nr:hypothetical protein [Clostridium sp. ZS2-4]MCY6355734.1 hypothetical protein [Clostridium sp. ZS2-4]